MAKDFADHELKLRDFVILPTQYGRGLRFGIVSFADPHEDSISLFTEDYRIVHGSSRDCLLVKDKMVPGATRKRLVDGMIGVFHPKETE